MSNENRSAVERVFQNAAFVHSLGIELIAHGAGWCETRVKISSALRQQHGFAHAGVVMTLADHTCGGAAASTVPADRDVITVENKISFLRPAAGAELTCRATVLRAGKNLVFVEAEVMSDLDAGRVLVAKMSSTLAVIALNAKPPKKLSGSV